MKFNQRVRSVQKKNNSLLCIGLDPDMSKIPVKLKRSRDPLYEFCKSIIYATCDLVCAYKLNLAFFEVQGSKGWDAMQKLRRLIPESVLCIGDGKRGDIGNTAEMYATGLLDDLGFDAVTVNPYMGSDSVLPFLEDSSKGAFVLTLTSNEGARDFQYLASGRKPLYQHVISRVLQWNRKGNCGLVVGATRPVDLRMVRRMAPELPILIPGIGAQGGDLKASVRNGCTKKSDLALINVGRTILYASNKPDFQEAARASARHMRDSMNEFRSTSSG